LEELVKKQDEFLNFKGITSVRVLAEQNLILEVTMSANLIPNPPVVTINQPEGIYWQKDILLTDPAADALADIYSFLLQRAARRKRQEALQLADTATVAEGVEVDKKFGALEHIAERMIKNDNTKTSGALCAGKQ